MVGSSWQAGGRWWLAAQLKQGLRVQAEPSKAVVRSVEWHPDGQVLLTAGLDKRLRFFQARLAASRTLPVPVVDVRRLTSGSGQAENCVRQSSEAE